MEQLGKFISPKLAEAPGSPVAGQLWYDTTNNVLKWYNGTEWLVAGVTNSWREIMEVEMAVTEGLTAATYLFSVDKEIGAEETSLPIVMQYLDPADYAVPGLTTKYRIRASLLTNATAPAITFTFGLYPITAVAGGANKTKLTKGTVTTGSTVAFATQAKELRAQGVSTEFTAPAAGYYAIGIVLSGTAAVSSHELASAHLQVRNV
jgi:hypothetical protein